MDRLNSFVPEYLQMQDKHKNGARLCREDCVIVDAANRYRVLAGRGSGTETGVLLEELYGLPASEMLFLNQALYSHRRVLLCGSRGAVLIFAEHLQSTDLLLAVRSHLAPDTFFYALSFCGFLPSACSEAFSHLSVGAAALNEEACNAVTELFYYMERIFSITAQSLETVTRSLLIANFTGYRLENPDVLPSYRSLSVSDTDTARLTMLLLCIFLILRKQTEEKRLPEQEASQSCRLCFYSKAEMVFSNQKSTDALKPLLALPAFHGFAIHETAQGILVQATLQKSDGDLLRVHAAGGENVCLQIQLVFS